MIKLVRAHGGCLGVKGRRRTWQAAKSFGELSTGVDPEISEWGNPPRGMPGERMLNRIGIRGARGELKHLSTLRKRKDSLSSGERKGRSLNPVRGSVWALRRGGCKRCRGLPHRPQGVRNRVSRKRALGRPAGEGESPVFERNLAPGSSLSTTGHANPVGSRGVHPPRLNTFNDR